MNDKLLEKFTRRVAPDLEESTDPDESESLGCFGWLRGTRDRAVMLELRKKDGHVLAVAYAWLERVEYRPDQGITLHFAGRQIRIRGSGLNQGTNFRLFDGIIRHRVPWIAEAGGAAFMHAPAVERIEWDE